MSQRLERLINLTATLLATRRPLTLDELADRLEPGYPDDLAARRRQFERDKETLRDLGVPVAVEPVDALGGELGYRIHPDDYYLPDPGLDAAERAALHLAVSLVDVAGVDPIDALRKLGGTEEGPPAGGPQPIAAFELTPHLGDLFDAVTRRSAVTFRYRDEIRHLEPYGILHRFGHWYVVGRDRDRDAPRSFRVDRIDGPPTLGEPGTFTAPAGVDPSDYLSSDPLTYGDDQPIAARVLVDAERAPLVVDALGDAAVVDRRADGAVVVELAVVNRDAFRTFVIDLLDHAEVLGPAELRADMIEWLRALSDIVERAR